MILLNSIRTDEAIDFICKNEDHFFDHICKDYSGEALQKKIVAFANADGGEVLVGIHDKETKGLSGEIFERWDGFAIQEDANNVITDVCKNIEPHLDSSTLQFEFFEIENYEKHGKVLKISVEKSPNVHYTASGNSYIRKGAQCLVLDNSEITNLQLSKGVTSYESQHVSDYEIKRLVHSEELKKFLNDYLPQTNPDIFLRKQCLLNLVDGKLKANHAGILLYDENPSAILPKKSALKIVYYDTSEEKPERNHMKRQYTIEGPVHEQINEGLKKIQSIIRSVSIFGPKGLERASYPIEAIKEVFVNAIIHRDYNISDDILILIFNNRIEIHSPGALPGHITTENILDERFSRNPKIVRLLNKYPDRPNYDIGEGLNTVFQKMKEVRLKEPIMENKKTKFIVILPHEKLASPEEQITEYLETHSEITNSKARELTGIGSENKVKNIFIKLKEAGYIERVPDKSGANSAWRKKIENFLNRDVNNKKGKNEQQNLFS